MFFPFHGRCLLHPCEAGSCSRVTAPDLSGGSRIRTLSKRVGAVHVSRYTNPPGCGARLVSPCNRLLATHTKSGHPQIAWGLRTLLLSLSTSCDLSFRGSHPASQHTESNCVP